MRGGGGTEWVWVTHLPGPAVGPHIVTADHPGQVGQVGGEPAAESCGRTVGCEHREQGPEQRNPHLLHPQTPKRKSWFLKIPGGRRAPPFAPLLWNINPAFLYLTRGLRPWGGRDVPSPVPSPVP